MATIDERIETERLRLQALTYNELRKEATKWEVKAKGKKEALLSKILTAMASSTGEAGPETVEGDQAIEDNTAPSAMPERGEDELEGYIVEPSDKGGKEDGGGQEVPASLPTVSVEAVAMVAEVESALETPLMAGEGQKLLQQNDAVENTSLVNLEPTINSVTSTPNRSTFNFLNPPTPHSTPAARTISMPSAMVGEDPAPPPVLFSYEEQEYEPESAPAGGVEGDGAGTTAAIVVMTEAAAVVIAVEPHRAEEREPIVEMELSNDEVAVEGGEGREGEVDEDGKENNTLNTTFDVENPMQTYLSSDHSEHAAPTEEPVQADEGPLTQQALLQTQLQHLERLDSQKAASNEEMELLLSADQSMLTDDGAVDDASPPDFSNCLLKGLDGAGDALLLPLSPDGGTDDSPGAHQLPPAPHPTPIGPPIGASTPSTVGKSPLKGRGIITQKFKDQHSRLFHGMPSIYESTERNRKRHADLTTAASERLARLATPRGPVGGLNRAASPEQGPKRARMNSTLLRFETIEAAVTGSAVRKPSPSTPKFELQYPGKMSFKFGGSAVVREFASVQRERAPLIERPAMGNTRRSASAPRSRLPRRIPTTAAVKQMQREHPPKRAASAMSSRLPTALPLTPRMHALCTPKGQKINADLAERLRAEIRNSGQVQSLRKNSTPKPFVDTSKLSNREFYAAVGSSARGMASPVNSSS